MIKINLLPLEEQQKAALQQKKILGVAAGCLVVGLLAMIWFYHSVKLIGIKGDIKDTETELAKIKPVVDEVARLETTKNNLQQRRNVIQNLLNGRLVYPKLMEDILGILPKDIWVLSIKSFPKGSQMQLDFTAKSFNNFAIADWIMNLEDHPKFGSVELKTITTSMQENTTVLNFGISCSYTGS